MNAQEATRLEVVSWWPLPAGAWSSAWGMDTQPVDEEAEAAVLLERFRCLRRLMGGEDLPDGADALLSETEARIHRLRRVVHGW